MVSRKKLSKEHPKSKNSCATVLLESDEFPFEFLSELAGHESWRKEIYRPIYHLHKWWATRLGSIFRGILLGCVLPPEADFKDAFHRPHALKGVTVFDPFMGSGTTVGEAHKLGCIALGRDINPVAAEAVRVALGPLDPHQIHEEFRNLEATVGRRIQQLYKALDEKGKVCDVLYYFWVKQVPCLHCGEAVDLFSSRIIGRNAFPQRKPEIRVSCAQCGNIFTATIHDTSATCPACGDCFNPKEGNARGVNVTCSRCHRSFAIVHAIRQAGSPPSHRLIGKLVLKPDGTKGYLPATDADKEAYGKCEQQLAGSHLVLPSLRLQDGYNTRQALNYGYQAWRDFFNARQLLALGWLHEAIAQVAHDSTRDALLTVFSSTLEFNNLFASYKGEGTGAVRHMFAHHILKPERTPIEANVWGTPKSSGAFSGLYRTRLLRAIEYRFAPVEIIRPRRRQGASAGNVIQCSEPFAGSVQTSWPPQGPLLPRSIHLSCGSSDDTALAPRSVDWIVTDPPFFDNVHYSELADFFFAWQSLKPRGFLRGHVTTRSAREVQDTRVSEFAAKLAGVFAECHRILKDEGLLVFTYHHSRPEGWSSVASAVHEAGFSIVNAHPVKAEMSVATPKTQAREPIQLDVILVCRKRNLDRRLPESGSAAFERAFAKAIGKASRLAGAGFNLSRNDRRVILFSQFLAELGPTTTTAEVLSYLSQQQTALEAALDDPAFSTCMNTAQSKGRRSEPEAVQGLLFE